MKCLSKILLLLIPIGLIPSLQAQNAFVAPARTDVVSLMHENGYKAWKRSLIPVIASQGLDVASSYGMRELNPVLAGSDGRFGVRAASIKFGTTAAIVGIEYLLVKKYPKAARILSKLNWSSSVVTTGFAVHNFAIR